MKLKSNGNNRKQKTASLADIFTPVPPTTATIHNRADVEEIWPMFRMVGKFFEKEVGPDGAPPVNAVLISRSMLSAPAVTESGGRVLVVGLDPTFEGHLTKLAVQKPHLANWYSLDFDAEQTVSSGHWYLNLPNGSRYLFAVSLDAIKQALNGGHHAHVLFVAGAKVAVGGFAFKPSDFARAQELERTVRDKPDCEEATFKAGISQAQRDGTSTPWTYRKYKLVTGAWRQHLNCIWLGMNGRKIETVALG